MVRREEKGESCVGLDVSSPTSSCHVEPDEKKLNGKNFSITILAALSSRTQKKKCTNTEQQRLEGRCRGEVNMSNQSARGTTYQLPPFPSLPRPGQRDKKAKRHRSPTKSANHTYLRAGISPANLQHAVLLCKLRFYLVLAYPPTYEYLVLELTFARSRGRSWSRIWIYLAS